MRLIILCFLLGIVLYGCQNKTPKIELPKPPLIQYDFSDSSLTYRIDTFLEKRFREKRFNGVALFAKHNKIVYHEAFGFSNFKTKDSLSKNDAFQLASVTKPITAIAILQLVEQGKIHLDSVVQHYIPVFPYSGITIRNLLSHRSGLSNYMYFIDEIWEDKFKPISNDTMLAIMTRMMPKTYYPPDVAYHYCNTNYALLATIIERVTNLSYEEYLQNNIFDRAEMQQSFVYNKCKTAKIPQEVLGHNAKFKLKDDIYLNGVVGDKGIYASALDLYKLDRKLHELVSDSLLQIAYSSHNSGLLERGKDDYGLGWRLQKDNTFGQVVFHSGWWKGFKTYYIRLLDQDSTIVILTNVTKGGFLNKMALQRLLFSKHQL